MLQATIRSSSIRNISNVSLYSINRFLSTVNLTDDPEVAASKESVLDVNRAKIKKNLKIIDKNIRNNVRIYTGEAGNFVKFDVLFRTSLSNNINFQQYCYNAAKDTLNIAMNENITLEDEDYETLFLLSCKATTQYSHKLLRRAVVETYKNLKKKDQLTESLLSAVLLSDTAWGESVFWENLELFEDKNYKLNDKTLSVCIGHFADSPLTESTKSLMMLYNLHKAEREERGWGPLTNAVYRKILLRYIRRQYRSATDKHRFPGLLEFYASVVNDMNEENIHYDKILPLLFDAALKVQDVNMIDSLLGFQLNTFIGSDNPSHVGRSTKLLEVAATKGRPDLSRIALQWKDNIGAKIGYAEHSLWLLSTAKKLDYIDVIDIIVQAEKDGIDLRNHHLYMQLMHTLFNDSFQYNPLNDAVECIENYLQYLHDDNIAIPRFAHDLLIAAYARVRRVEDAYAVFDRLPDKDILTYNMLVYVHSYFKNADPIKVLDIFQEMEQEGFKPDSTSFTHLFHSMASSQNPQALGEILDYLESQDNDDTITEKVHPDGFSIFRLAKKLRRINGEDELFERLKEYMPEVTKNHLEFDTTIIEHKKGVKHFLQRTLY